MLEEGSLLAELVKSGNASHNTPHRAWDEATEVLSHQAPPTSAEVVMDEVGTLNAEDREVPAKVDTRASKDREVLVGIDTTATEEWQILAEVHASVTGAGEISSISASGEGNQIPSELCPEESSGSSDIPMSSVPPHGPSVAEQATAGWPAIMEDAFTGCSITEEHRTLMGAVLQSIQSINNRPSEAFNGLLACFKVSRVMFKVLL